MIVCLHQTNKHMLMFTSLSDKNLNMHFFLFCFCHSPLKSDIHADISFVWKAIYLFFSLVLTAMSVGFLIALHAHINNNNTHTLVQSCLIKLRLVTYMLYVISILYSNIYEVLLARHDSGVTFVFVKWHNFKNNLYFCK